MSIGECKVNDLVTRLRKLDNSVTRGVHYGFEQSIWLECAAEIERLERELHAGLDAWRVNSRESAARIDALERSYGMACGILRLIECGQRSDGTWNRDREACRQLAADFFDTTTKD